MCDMEHDSVVIVGTGLSGLVAGYEAMKKGLHVIFLDQESRENLGGQAFLVIGWTVFRWFARTEVLTGQR